MSSSRPLAADPIKAVFVAGFVIFVFVVVVISSTSNLDSREVG